MTEIDRREFLGSMMRATVGLCGFGGLKPTAVGALQDASNPSASTVCPKSSRPAKTIWALKIPELDILSYSEPFQNQPEQRLTLTCLQGLVNRRQPQIFLAFDRFDELWLQWLRERGDVHEIRWVGTEQLYEKFLPAVSQLVVTDPDLPGSINVATMLAATQGWLPVTPRVLPLFDLPIAMDLRGRWEKDIEAYRWFYSTYGDQLTDRACACLGPAIFELRDYVVEFKVPLFWVSPHDPRKAHVQFSKNSQVSKTASPAEEEEFVRELLLKLPPNIPCLGWWDHGVAGQEEIGEQLGVTLASQYAKFQVCTAFDGYCRGFSNFSVHSGTTATFKQKVYPPPALEDKIYVACIRTDGDGPNFWRQAYRKLWDDPDHGKVPVAWQLGPAMYDLCPGVLDYYHRHATADDTFVNALTGIGYIHETEYAVKLPESQRAAIWDAYIELSNRYFKLLDFSVLTTWGQMPSNLLERFTRLSGLQGIFAHYLRNRSTTVKNQTSEVKGVPVFRAVTGNASLLGTPAGHRRAVEDIVKEIKSLTPERGPAFLFVSLTNWAVDMKVIVDIQKALGSDYVFVRPDQLTALYRQAKKRTLNR
jgi:hypothetical protein